VEPCEGSQGWACSCKNPPVARITSRPIANLKSGVYSAKNNQRKNKLLLEHLLHLYAPRPSVTTLSKIAMFVILMSSPIPADSISDWDIIRNEIGGVAKVGNQHRSTIIIDAKPKGRETISTLILILSDRSFGNSVWTAIPGLPLEAEGNPPRV
jgi:hypothetical protein